MRRAIALVLSVALALSLCSAALAAEINITANPAELTQPGTVALTFTVRNTSAVDMTNFDISGYGGISGGSDLRNSVVHPSGALEFVLRNVEIGADMLGQPIEYTLSWLEGGEAKSQSASITLGSAVPETTELMATREASKTAAAKGEKVTLTYTLQNPSDSLTITDIALKDPIAGSSAIQSGLSLAPGESKKITYEYTVTDQDATSTPAFTYRVNGEDLSLALDSLKITTVSVSVDVAVSMGENTPEGILFSIVLKNTGNQSIEKMRVTDELGNKVNEDPFTLEAGTERTLSYTVLTDALRHVSFTITGTDSLGQPYENRTTAYEAWPYVDSSLVSLSLVATVLEPLSEAGNMKIRFAVQNNSSVSLTDAVLSEEQLGELHQEATLPLGETILEETLAVGAPRELVFTLLAKDPSGAEHTYQARLTADYVALATPIPADTPAPEEEAPVSGGLSDTLMTVLIVLAVLMAIAGIALLVLSIYEKRNNARLEADDAIDPSAPVRFASQEEQPPAQPRPNAVRQPGAPPAAAEGMRKAPRPEQGPMRVPESFSPGYESRNVRPVPPPAEQRPSAAAEAVRRPRPVEPARPVGTQRPASSSMRAPMRPDPTLAPPPVRESAPRINPEPAPRPVREPLQADRPAPQPRPAEPIRPAQPAPAPEPIRTQPPAPSAPPAEPPQPVQPTLEAPHFIGRNRVRYVHPEEDE